MTRVPLLFGAVAVTAFASAMLARREAALSAPPILRPGSSSLSTGHFRERCDSVRMIGPDSTGGEHAIYAERVEERLTTQGGTPALLIVARRQGWSDSAVVKRDGLGPVTEVSVSSARTKRYTYDGARVRISNAARDSAATVTDHSYDGPVFNFQELDQLLRSIALRAGYEALLPMYSEGDDWLEIDTIRVEGRDPAGVWHIRFADPVIIASVSVDEKTRTELAYSRVFRNNGPLWAAGAVWRKEFHACRS